MNEYFVQDVFSGWDGRIKMQSVPGKLDYMELLEPLPCGASSIPKGYQWDGSSSGIFRNVIILNFPKWKHPIASCRHDWRCQHAKNKKQRAFADKMFKKDVAKGGTWWEKTKGYVGVKIGSWFKTY